MTAEQNYDFFAHGENEDDHIGSIYPQDVVRFMYDGKIYNEVVETLLEGKRDKNSASLERIAIRHLDKDQDGAVITNNLHGGPEKDALSFIFVLNELMPDQQRTKNDLCEKMFISFSGVWGSEKIGGWVKKNAWRTLRMKM